MAQIKFIASTPIMVTALMLAHTALAADLGGYQGNSAPSSSGPLNYIDFSGINLGVDAGIGVGSAGSANTSGTLAGLHIGYLFQAVRLIGGIEVDTMTTNISTGKLTSSTYDQNFLSSARIKGGYVFGDLAAYGTIGYGYSTSAFKDNSGSSSSTLRGNVYGFGAEYAITHSITLRAELLRYNFGDHTYTTPTTTTNLATTTNLLRLGASVHF
jgi:opacity protein-like surface antigen